MCIDRVPQTVIQAEDHTDELADLEHQNSFSARVSASGELGKQKQQEEKPGGYLLLVLLFHKSTISLCR